MANTLLLTVENQNPTPAIRNFLKSVLHDDTMQAILVPARQDGRSTSMPCLIHDPALLDQADPFHPFFPLNAARLAARLSVKPVKGKMAFVLRPCEIRALVELEKLKQADLENCLLIGMDCAGAYTDKAEINAQDIIDIPDPNDAKLAAACRACEHFVPENTDLVIGRFGVNPEEKIMIQAGTDAGMAVLENVARETGQSLSDAPSEREKTVADILDARVQFRDAMFETTRTSVDSHKKFTRYFERCINCYNCRVACPVCYCRECVFNTDVFDHEPFQYLQWARRKGAVKLPADTVFYHMTRLAHMSLSCVGCGQCSNACPNDIPVMELFRTTAFDVQNAFDYEPGRDRDEPLPLSVFREKEFTDIEGID